MNVKFPSTSENLQYVTQEWAKHVIWYQIFPERFRNGDSTNNPTAERIGAPDNWEITPWTSGWYKRVGWECSMGDKFTDSVYHRRYGGDLQGIIDKLDYLQELGIGALYLNPVFDAISLHKYDTSHYHHVDRFYGPDPEGDKQIMIREDPVDPSTWQWTSADQLFLKLIEDVHDRGMKIIIDGVFNHTGTDFWAFRDLKKHQRESAYKDWYAINSFADSKTASSDFDYNGWWDFKELPEFNQIDGTLVEPVRRHIFEITHRWMDPDGDGDPSDGVDGWRLDVPEEIGKVFWREWNALVRSINPEAYTVGEIWSSESREWVSGELFTAAMNYPFAETVQNYMIDQSISASQFLNELNAQRDNLPENAPWVMQNLMDSHDTPRLASMVVNPGREYNKKGKPKYGFNVRKPNVSERRLQKLIALFQFCYVGAPMIYYGTEAGMWGAGDPDDRKPMVWPEFDYEPESKDPLNRERPVDDNNFDEHLYSWYKKLCEIRNIYPVLRVGNFKALKWDDAQNMITFARSDDNYNPVFIALNRSEKTQQMTIPLDKFDLSEGSVLTNVLTQTQIRAKDNQVAFRLPPVSGAILIPEEE